MSGGDAQARIAGIWTLPNMLTLGRIVLVAPLAWLILLPGATAAWLALLLYGLAAATDWLDGYLARRLGHGSALGAALDPVADKVLVVAVMVCLVATDVLAGAHLVAVILILGREFVVAGLREGLAPKGFALPVSPLAKWKTASQMVAMAALIALPIDLPGLEPVALGLLWLSVVLTVITGAQYVAGALRFLAETRA